MAALKETQGNGPFSASSGSCRRRCAVSYLYGLFLVAVVLAVFGQVYSFQFLVYDDELHVVDNPNLNPPSWNGLLQHWQAHYWNLYVPLSYTFFAAEGLVARQPQSDGAGSSPNPMVFHLGNLALHLACMLLVFKVLRRLCGDDLAAAAGTLLFAIHPVQVESIAWISETRGLLCATLSLVAIWQYVRYVDAITDATSEARPSSARRRLYLSATVAFVLALLCKPAAVVVPLVIAALDVGLFRSPWRHLIWPVGSWLILALAWSVFTKTLQPNEELPRVAPLWARPLIAGDAMAFYLGKLAIPWPLGPDYGRTPERIMGTPWFYLAWLVPACAVALLACIPPRRQWLTAAAIFIAVLLPILGLVPFVFQRISTVADRYLYLALLGPAMALSWLLSAHRNRWTVSVVSVALALLAVLSFVQTGYWRDNEAFLTHTLRVNPRSVLALHNRGFLLARAGKHVDAIKWYRTGLLEHPDHLELYFSLAASLSALDQPAAAVSILREAQRRFPDQPLIHCELGDLLARQNATLAAEDEFRLALHMDPHLTRAHLGWGALLLDRGQADAAIEHFRRVLDTQPDHVPARVNLAVALQAQGKTDEARHHYEEALRVRPDWPAAHYNFGNLLVSQGALEEAMGHYQLALCADPRHARAHVNLGAVLVEQGQVDEAIQHFRAALRENPRLAEAHVHLGQALGSMGRLQDAASEFQAALKLVPADSRQAKEILRLLQSLGAP